MQNQSRVNETKYEKIMRRRGLLIMVAALVIAFAVQMGGVILKVRLDEVGQKLFAVVLVVSASVPLLCVPIMLCLRHRYISRLNDVQVAQMQAYLLKHKENAEQISEKLLGKLCRIRCMTNGMAVLLTLFGVGVSCSSGVLFDTDWSVTFLLLGAILLLSGISQLRFPEPEALFSEDMSYLNPERYPKLFALARKAAAALGCEGRIEIGIMGDFNGGITRVGNTYSIRLGVLLLSLLSEEELYSVLLHEFGHMVAENADADREKNYHAWISNGRTPHFLYGLVSLCYLLPDTVYSFNLLLYDYACSVRCETAADRAMAEHANPAYAASALLKMKYYDLYEWEDGTADGNMFFASEEPPAHVFADQIDRFREAMKTRAEDWNALVDVEIPARSATHPTLKMRLAELGVTECKIAESEDSPGYRDECELIQRLTEERFLARGSADYKGKRLEAYMMPLARVAEWEQAGKPLTATGYADVINDLRSVGRVTDAMELCDRAILTLDTAASCYAYYMRGMYRLHRYDPAGLDDVYHAIANNSNFIEEGLDIIGQFCCLTGRQEELDLYRNRAVDVGQWQKDVQEEMNVLRKKDQLESEPLTEELMAGLLEFLRTLDAGELQEVYLVRKVINSEAFFSPVVVRFAKDVSDEKQGEIMHKLFRWLDTCSDWQFALFEYSEVKQAKVERVPNSLIYPIAKEQ